MNYDTLVFPIAYYNNMLKEDICPDIKNFCRQNHAFKTAVTTRRCLGIYTFLLANFVHVCMHNNIKNYLLVFRVRSRDFHLHQQKINQMRKKNRDILKSMCMKQSVCAMEISFDFFCKIIVHNLYYKFTMIQCYFI